MGASNFISQQSVSLRESKGQIETNIADAMGFNAYNGGGKIILTQAISTFMGSTAANGYSAGSGNSIGSGKNFSVLLSAAATVVTANTRYSAAYNVSALSLF